MLDSDIKTYHAEEVSSVSTNGGRMSNDLVQSGEPNNVFPQVPRRDRIDGVPHFYRKLFTLAADDDDGSLLNTWQWVERVIASDDYVVMFAGTQSDTQADIAGSERKYGYAFLTNDITAGDSTYTVTVKHADLASGADAIFQAGDLGRPSTMATPDADTGDEEFPEIDSVSVSGLDVTITIVGTFANSYLVADDAFFVSIMDKGDIACSIANFVVTSAGDGDYNVGSYPIIPDNIGTVEDSITLEFTDATHYTVTGASGINYGSGDTATDFEPTNTDKTKPYFKIEAAGFSGTFSAAVPDTITFDIHPAAYSYWLDRRIPTNCTSLANNKVTAVTAGESAA